MTLIRHIFVYGVAGGALIAFLKMIEYKFLVIEHSLEIYGGLVALVFSVLGIALGLKLTRRPPAEPVSVPDAAFSPDETKIAELGVTPRELEILDLIAKGLSNREIAETLFVSENTVKTHSSRLFDKLSAKRRTHAVQIGKDLGLIR